MFMIGVLCLILSSLSEIPLTVFSQELNSVSDDVNQNFQNHLQRTYNSKIINLNITSEPKWPDETIRLGQVSSVSIDPDGNVFVFHRGPVIWNVNSFQRNEVFSDISSGPIQQPTIAVIHPETGTLLYEWGEDKFYLPHGITVDHDRNVWITDVAMHQVIKYPSILDRKIKNIVPILTLGTKFVPGRSPYMFCKPTAVAVMTSGEFFVSDGYCNSRILKYSASGEILTQWGRNTLSMGMLAPPYNFYIPHDLTLAEDNNLLCVSDRENGRVQCFQTLNGSFVFQIESPDIGNRVFSASYSPVNGGLLYIINGDDGSNSIHGSVVSLDSDSFEVVKVFQPNTSKERNFMFPHQLKVSPDGSSLYVAELNPPRVWKFNIDLLQSVSPKTAERSAGSEIIVQNEKITGNVGTMLIAILIMAIVLCLGAVLLTVALMYSRAKTRGCAGQCNNAKWLIGRSTGEGFKIGDFLGQQHQGFVKLSNCEESDEDDANIRSTFA